MKIFVTALFLGLAVCDKTKTLPADLFNKHHLLRPITDAVTNFVALTKHPNFGGVQLLNPVHLWEKLHQKHPGYLTGPHGATFGVAHHGPPDYPFAYRKTND